MTFRRPALLLAVPLALLLLAACAALRHEAPAAGHPAGNGPAMVVAAHPLAAEAGREMLRRGGTAVDAAVAVQAVLTLVEPESSGIGGGAFMLRYDGKTGKVSAFDGRETAPAGISPRVFLRPDGTPKKFYDAVVGGQSVGVPGVLAMLTLAHREHGKLPWKELFQPAIRLASDGFAVTPRLHMMVARDRYLKTDPVATRYFYGKDGKAPAVGSRLRNPALAATLRTIAEKGPEALYHGAIARDIAAKVQHAPRNRGSMTTADLASYRAKERTPVCRPYRRWRVCGMPPPTSGGIAVLQMLGLLERFDLSRLAPTSPEAIHLLAEAGRLAFADRNRYVADTDFVPVPVKGLLDSHYLAARSQLIDPNRALPSVLPGNPPRKTAYRFGAGRSPELPSTSHFSIVDRWGNAVSMTTSVENAFGSRLMVDGFMLNNQLTDFDFKPTDDRGRPVANRVAPDKRPRSSMSPTLVLDRNGRLVMAVGSPGGPNIIGYVAQAIVAVLDWRLTMQQAVALPRYVDRSGPVLLEKDAGLGGAVAALRAMGHTVRFRRMTSGLHGIHVLPDGSLEGGADPRREGVVVRP